VRLVVKTAIYVPAKFAWEYFYLGQTWRQLPLDSGSVREARFQAAKHIAEIVKQRKKKDDKQNDQGDYNSEEGSKQAGSERAKDAAAVSFVKTIQRWLSRIMKRKADKDPEK
jgi:hypothetical protein